MLIKCDCQQCHGPLEYESDEITTDTIVECPHCKMETTVFVSKSAPPPPISVRIAKPKKSGKPSKLKIAGWTFFIIFILAGMRKGIVDGPNEPASAPAIQHEINCAYVIIPDDSGEPGVSVSFSVVNNDNVDVHDVDLQFFFYDARGDKLGSSFAGFSKYDYTLKEIKAHATHHGNVFISHEKLGFNPNLIDRAVLEILH
jgi:hypothetical protein